MAAGFIDPRVLLLPLRYPHHHLAVTHRPGVREQLDSEYSPLPLSLLRLHPNLPLVGYAPPIRVGAAAIAEG